MPRPSVVLYQPDIPGNAGAILRLGACLAMDIHIIGPAGFDLSDRALRRAGMDYLEIASLTEHVSWEAFEAWRAQETRRLVLASTHAARPYTEFDYRDDDLILFGRESAGVPGFVHESADHRIMIPMRPGVRSINLALSVAMIASECVRHFGVPSEPVTHS